VVEERFFTPDEVAKKLNISPRTVQRWLAQGKMAHYELDKRVKRIPESVIDKLLNKSLKARKHRMRVQ
jgi:excisionase family DNA binding protein